MEGAEESGRALSDTQPNDDETVVRMGHPDCAAAVEKQVSLHCGRDDTVGVRWRGAVALCAIPNLTTMKLS